MKQHATTAQGLHYSNITRSRKAKTPRGCALSWSIFYMSHFAPQPARSLYRRYKQHFLIDYLVGFGFREWPYGVKGFVDADTGPIVGGIGAAATAFGIGAARRMGDLNLSLQLQRTRRWGTRGARWFGGHKLHRQLANLLTQAIILNTDSATDR